MRFRKSRQALVVRFSLVVGWTVRSCGYVGFCYDLSLGLPLTAPLYQFRIVQAHFTNCAGCKNVVKTAFVQLKLQENRYSIQSKPITIQTIPYRYQQKQTTQSRVSLRNKLRATPTKEKAKHHVAAETNSLSPQ